MGCRAPGREAAWVTPWRGEGAPGAAPVLRGSSGSGPGAVPAAGGAPRGWGLPPWRGRTCERWPGSAAGPAARFCLFFFLLFFFPFWKKFNRTHTWQRGGGKQQGCVA